MLATFGTGAGGGGGGGGGCCMVGLKWMFVYVACFAKGGCGGMCQGLVEGSW